MPTSLCKETEQSIRSNPIFLKWEVDKNLLQAEPAVSEISDHQKIEYKLLRDVKNESQTEPVYETTIRNKKRFHKELIISGRRQFIWKFARKRNPMADTLFLQASVIYFLPSAGAVTCNCSNNNKAEKVS